MTRIYLAFDDGLAVLRRQDGRWHATPALDGRICQSLAVDPHGPQRIYCGTFHAGLWRSDDGGAAWAPVSAALPHQAVMAVAVSSPAASNEYGRLWAGTEPSALFFSDDGGESWEESTGLQQLPSKDTWSFPPRPWTHHVRWIEPDATTDDRIFAGIELGGVMRSLDGGETWEDRKPGSQHDCHTLRTHPHAPGVIYEAAGGGFAESHDGGATWRSMDEGLPDHYLWGLAVDSTDPGLLVVSASPGARSAHNDQHAQAALYRRVGRGSWQLVGRGLPAPQGTRAYVLASHPQAAGRFYAATRQDVFQSDDGGQSWQQLDIVWPDDFHSTTVNAMSVVATA